MRAARAVHCIEATTAGQAHDVDPVSDREKMGVIPGALVLSSWHKFDVATELPPDKKAKLVFYCYNWL